MEATEESPKAPLAEHLELVHCTFTINTKSHTQYLLTHIERALLLHALPDNGMLWVYQVVMVKWLT